MANVVHDDVILRSYKGVDDSIASHPSGWEYQDVHVPIFRQLILEL